jgi:hypothetical protein
MPFPSARGPSPALVVAVAAIVLALAAGAWAGAKLPKKSVGPEQLQSNAVTSKKVKDGSLKKIDFAPDELPAGATGPQGPKGDPGPPGEPGENGATNVVVRSGTTAHPGATSTAVACDFAAHEVATGGGGIVGGGAKLTASIPYYYNGITYLPIPSGETPNAWLAEADIAPPTTAWVVCASP